MKEKITVKSFSTDSLEVMYHLAYTRYKQGLYVDSEGLFRLLTVANTSERKYWMGLGLSLHCNKKYKEALDAYEMAAALDPKDPHANLQAAECFFALGSTGQGLIALEYAERCLQLQKSPEEGHKTRIALLRAAWNPEKGNSSHAPK